MLAFMKFNETHVVGTNWTKQCILISFFRKYVLPHWLHWWTCFANTQHFTVENRAVSNCQATYMCQSFLTCVSRDNSCLCHFGHVIIGEQRLRFIAWWSYVVNSQVVPPGHFGTGGRTASDGEGDRWKLSGQTQHKYRGGFHTLCQVIKVLSVSQSGNC